MSSRWNCVCECDGKWKEMWHEGSAHSSTAAFGAALGVLIMRHTRLCPGDSRDGWLPLLSLPASAATAELLPLLQAASKLKQHFPSSFPRSCSYFFALTKRIFLHFLCCCYARMQLCVAFSNSPCAPKFQRADALFNSPQLARCRQRRLGTLPK